MSTRLSADGPAKILQIIPADGWRAIYGAESATDPEQFTVELACLALIESPDGLRSVAGVDLDPDGSCSLVELDRNFIGYRRGPLPEENPGVAAPEPAP